MSGAGEARYTYGDSPVAARRLRLLADTYEATTRALLQEVVAGPGIGVAADLGCGPGYTTALLGEMSRPVRLIGVDSSARMLEEVAVNAPNAERVLHDAAVVPFPFGSADLLACRFLIGHLAQPLTVLEGWARTLAPGGTILVEEYEGYDCADPAVRRYLEIAEGMVVSGGGELRIGPTLAGLERVGGLGAATNRATAVHPPAAMAAEIFGLNITAMRDSAWVSEHVGAAELDALADGLAAFGASDAPMTLWVRQVAFRAVN